MKILILGSPNSQESKLLVKAGSKRKHDVFTLIIDDLIFEGGKKALISYKGRDIVELFDAVIVRGMNKHPDETLLLAKYLNERGVIVVDKRLAKKRYYRTKLATALKFAKSKINYPKTYFVAGNNSLKEALDKIEFPIIVKEIWGMHSKGVLRFKNKKKANNFFRDKKGEYLLQEDLKENEYLRVFVLDGRVLGAMKRKKKRPLTNKAVKSGVKSIKIDAPKELIEVAVHATKISGNDICGLDIIKHQDKYYIIEANRSPQFRAFSEIVGVDIATEIIRYLEILFKK